MPCVSWRLRSSSPRKAATALRRLLGLKDEAHYGFFDVGGQQLKSALRQASDLVEFAQGILRR